MDALQITVKFLREKTKLFEQANAVTDSYNTLAKIYFNTQLFSMVNRYCGLYSNVANAIYDANGTSQFVVYFEDMDLYGVFSTDKYRDFLVDVQHILEDNVSVNLYQVVFSGERQKLVIACSVESQFDKLSRYAAECFSATVVRECNQIVVNIVNNCESELIDRYTKLYSYIYNKKDYQCCDSMKQVQLIQSMQYKYRKYRLSTRVVNESTAFLYGTFNDTPGKQVIQSQDSDEKYNNVVNNMNRFQFKRPVATNWVRNNAPNEREKTTDYYTRYINANPDGVADNQFGKIVRELGYDVVKDNGVRYWRIDHTRSTGMSADENICAKALSKILPNYSFVKIRFDWLRNPTTDRNLELDFYCEELKIAIEVDGRQHVEMIPHFHPEESNFHHQVERDIFKDSACTLMGIRLLRIPYNKLHNAEELITEFLQD